MNLFGVMEVSGSALKAERIRAEVVAANMANAETTRTADGTPYKRQHVVFAAAEGTGMDGAGALGTGANGTGANFQSQLLAAGGSIFPTGQATPGGVEVTAVVADRASGGAPLRPSASRRR